MKSTHLFYEYQIKPTSSTRNDCKIDLRNYSSIKQLKILAPWNWMSIGVILLTFRYSLWIKRHFHSNMPFLGIWYKKAKLILPRDACVHQSWSDKGCLPFQGLMFQWLHFLSEKKRQNWQTCIGFVLVSKPDQIQKQFVAAYTRSLNSDSYKFCSRNCFINIFTGR